MVGLLAPQPTTGTTREVLHPGWGARLVAKLIADGSDRDWSCPRELSWHPSTCIISEALAHPPGCSTIRCSFPVVVRGKEGTTTGYSLPTLRVGLGQ